jgi:hypothetical protein
MKTLKDFTPEVQAKIPEYIKNGLKGVFDGGRYKAFDIEKAKKAVFFNYERCGYKKPVVLVAGNPYESQFIINYVKKNPELTTGIYLLYCLQNKIEIKDSQLRSQLDSQLYSQLRSQLRSQLYSQLYSQLRSQLRSQLYSQLRSQLNSQLYSQLDSAKIERYEDYLFTLNVYSSCYFAWFQFMAKELKIDAKINADLEIFSSLYEESNIYSAVFSELLCVVSKFPKKVYRDDENRLHNTKGVAVEWENVIPETAFDCYYIHGRNIPKDIAEVALNGELTKEVFVKEQNDEYRSAWYNYLGEEKMLSVLGAQQVDVFNVTHGNGEAEIITLFKTKEKLNKVKNKPYAWLKRICPSTGNVYLTPTDPDFKSAEESAKFHRPDWVPTSLGYLWYSRS